MCKDCGCGLPGETPARISGHQHHESQSHGAHDHVHPHDHDQDHEHTHEHTHADGHTHTHSHGHIDEQRPRKHRLIEVGRAILENNNRLAERNRGFFRARGLLTVNVLSSPGSGKTTLIRETIRNLGSRLKTGVIVGDLATDNDARRLRESATQVVQVTTGTVCHLEADMVARAVGSIDLTDLGLLIIENVGNLVCPASYDLGEDMRVVVLSVTEGEDKPLKYPPMFRSAGALVVSKIDLAQACDYDRNTALNNLHQLAPEAPVFELSAKTGQGMDAWCEFLLEKHRFIRSQPPLTA